MADESVKTAFARLLDTIDQATPHIHRLVEDMRLAADAIVASEERHEEFNKRAIEQLRAAGTTIEEKPVAAPALALVPAPVEAPAEPAPDVIVATDENPFIEQDPSAWIEAKGAKGSMKGMRLSECPVEYLDMLSAGLFKRANLFTGRGKLNEAAADIKLATTAKAHADRLRPKPKHQAEHRTIGADDVLKGRAK